MSQRFGRPQLYALLLLLALLAQGAWAMLRAPLSETELAYIRDGRLHWLGEARAGDALHSALPYLLAAAPTFLFGAMGHPLPQWAVQALVRLPFLAVALLLGASLWYVARRLYGNAGGYVALALFCFSPAAVAMGARVEPAALAAWGGFGGIFNSIAATHTLYAPLDWRQRMPRVLLLAVSVAAGVSGSYAAALLLVPAAVFMFYLVPGRRAAAGAIFAAAVALGLASLAALYLVSSGPLLGGTVAAGSTRLSPVLLVLLLAALVTYAAWPRARYFGNTAPLVALAALLAPVPAARQSLTHDLVLIALPFAMLFVAGIAADLLETRHRRLVVAAVTAAVVAQVVLGA